MQPRAALEAARALAIPPSPRVAAGKLSGWTISVLAHAAALSLAVLVLERGELGRRIERPAMVFVEPAPRAPAAPAAVPLPQPPVERPKGIPKPKRLVVRRGPPPLELPPPVVQAPVESTAGGGGGGEVGGKVGGVGGGEGDAPIPADRVDHPPVVVSRVLPAYPPMARARGIEGLVILRAVVDREGRVEEAMTVVKSVPVFDAAAVGALRRWRFQPGRDRDGETVRVLVEVPMRFQLR